MDAGDHEDPPLGHKATLNGAPVGVQGRLVHVLDKALFRQEIECQAWFAVGDHCRIAVHQVTTYLILCEFALV